MSVSVSSNATDLAEKFQRLSKEYHKVKEMCKVLSTGVNSERAKSLKLETDLKEKEAAFRKLLGEKEAIEFHNLQLTKRIELLKEELDKKPVASRKKKLKQAEVNVDELYNKIKILEDELCNKLHSNEALTNQERESHLLAEIEEQKQKMKDIQFMTKLAPLVASYTAANNLSLNQQNGFTRPDSQNVVVNANSINQSSEEEEESPAVTEGKNTIKIDVEIQTDLELNNNKVPENEKLINEIASKTEEISRLTENIRRLEDVKEKQSLDITLLKKKLELAGNSPTGMDSAEQATKLARVRIREVLNQKEEAENTARFYEKEIKYLQLNIREILDSKQCLQDKINELEKANTIVSEELVSVRKSYGTQLSQMSDLVIELNKKIQLAENSSKQETTTSAPRTFRNLFGK